MNVRSFQFGGKEVGSFTLLTITTHRSVGGRGCLHAEFWNRESNHHPEAVVINYHKLCGSEQWEFTGSQFWRLEVEMGPSVGPCSLPCLQGRGLPGSVSWFWWWPTVLRISWVVAAYFQSLPPCSLLSALCLSQFPSAYGDSRHWLWPVLVLVDLSLTPLHLQRPCFSVRSHSQVLDGCECLGDVMQLSTTAFPECPVI